MTRGWRITAVLAAVAVFVAVLVDPAPDPVPLLGDVPGVVLAVGWAALAFGWVWMLSGVARGFCWLRGEAACRLPRE